MKNRTWLLSSFVISIAVVLVAAIERHLVTAACGGTYIYPIDDTYIHIAMGRTLAESFTWGVEPGTLAFCSSSPLWTLLLGGLYWIFGTSDMLTWYLALGFNLATVFVVCRFLHSRGAKLWQQMVGTALVAIAGPFVSTTALGMEHAMHAFFILAALACSFSLPRAGLKMRLVSCGVAAAATASRYESMFVLLPIGLSVCALESYYRWQDGRRPIPMNGIGFLVASGLPIFVYGLWAISQGGHMLPNSLLLKGSFHTIRGVFYALMENFGSLKPGYGFLYLLMLALAAVAILRPTPLFWRLAAVSLFMAIVGQVIFAAVGQLCRYEAFLTTAGVFVLVVALTEGGFGPRPIAYIPMGLCGLGFYIFLTRAIVSFSEVAYSSTDIYSQQVQMTKILADLPKEDRGCVALNDLGYMALHGGFDFVDIWGLGSQDVTELLLKHSKLVLREDIERVFLDHNVRYAAVFESWYPSRVMPEDTCDVATLTLAQNHICGSDKVVFRATSKESADRLARHLEKYVDKLPPRASLRIFR